MIKNATFYALNTPLAADPLRQGLEKLQFAPATGLQVSNLGWVPPFGGTDLVFEVDQVKVIALRIDVKVLPASAVAMAVREKCLELEREQGFKCGRRQTKEVKEQVVDAMLTKAFSRTTITNVYIWSGMMLIDSTSPGVTDTVVGTLAKCVEPFPVTTIHLKTAPAAAMTGWLLEDEAPEFFSIDQEAELQSPDSRNSIVRYVRAPVPVDQIQHRQCVKLALTYDDRISFLLTDAFTFKRISLLDVTREGREDYAENEWGRLEGEVALITREVRGVFNALIHELGLKIDEGALV